MADFFPLPAHLAAMLDDFPLEQLAFTPVPVKPRHDGWTAERQRGFILRLALCGSPTMAARGVGKSRESAYRLRARPGADSFGDAWDTALGWGRDHMIDLAIERSLLGEVRPIFYRGRKVGEHRHHDDRIALVVLKHFDRVRERAALKG